MNTLGFCGLLLAGCVVPAAVRETEDAALAHIAAEVAQREAEEDACLRAELDWRRTYIAAMSIPLRAGSALTLSQQAA